MRGFIGQNEFLLFLPFFSDMITNSFTKYQYIWPKCKNPEKYSNSRLSELFLY